MKCILDDNIEYRLEGCCVGVDWFNVMRYVKVVVLGFGGVIGYLVLYFVLFVCLLIWRMEKCFI